jgi:hypothetical protein
MPLQIETHHPVALGSEALDAVAGFFVGMGVGMLATCFNAPFDVVKSRMQVSVRRCTLLPRTAATAPGFIWAGGQPLPPAALRLPAVARRVSCRGTGATTARRTRSPPFIGVWPLEVQVLHATRRVVTVA